MNVHAEKQMQDAVVVSKDNNIHDKTTNQICTVPMHKKKGDNMQKAAAGCNKQMKDVVVVSKDKNIQDETRR